MNLNETFFFYKDWQMLLNMLAIRRLMIQGYIAHSTFLTAANFLSEGV